MKMSLLARLPNRKSTLESGLKPPPAQHAAVAGRSATAGQTDSVAAITALANQQFQAGELNSARDLYKRILELDPGSARAYYMLSGIAAQEGDIASAIGLTRRAIALQPAVANFTSLGGIYVSAGRVDAAVASFSRRRD
jgi:Tfp pilus assembly protein PilF